MFTCVCAGHRFGTSATCGSGSRSAPCRRSPGRRSPSASWRCDDCCYTLLACVVVQAWKIGPLGWRLGVRVYHKVSVECMFPVLTQRSKLHATHGWHLGARGSSVCQNTSSEKRVLCRALFRCQL